MNSSTHPIRIIDADVAAQAGRIQWIPFGKATVVQGIETWGGFYVQPPGDFEFSFAIITGLPVGDWKRAEPRKLRPRQRQSYRALTQNQRAAYLQWLAGSPFHDVAHASGFVSMRLSGLEWFQLACPGHEAEVFNVVRDILDTDMPPFASRKAVNLLSWLFFPHGKEQQLAMLDLLLDGVNVCISALVLEQAVANLADFGRAIRPALALELAKMYDAQHTEWSDDSFQNRFLRTFSTVYPTGLPIDKPDRRSRLEYQTECWELGNRELTQPQSYWTAEIPEYIRGHILTTLTELRKRVLSMPVLNLAKLKALQIETDEIQRELQARLPIEPQISPVRAEKPTPGLAELDGQCRDAVTELLRRESWNAAEFKAVATRAGWMPYALHRVVNEWSTTLCDEALLKGEDPVVINRNITRLVQHQI